MLDISFDYVVVDKQFNYKFDGGEYISGLGIYFCKINYIFGRVINQQVMNYLKNGDYIGVYFLFDGLDVLYVGIVVCYDEQVWFRNVFLLVVNRKVVDILFMEYMYFRLGIVVLWVE